MASLMLDFSSYIARHTHDFIGREWVFKEVDCWLSKPDASRYFLLTGNPGSGKTALAARLIQMSDGLVPISPVYQSMKPGVLSAIHFCSAREGKWINPNAFIESIALVFISITGVMSTNTLGLKSQSSGWWGSKK